MDGRTNRQTNIYSDKFIPWAADLSLKFFSKLQVKTQCLFELFQRISGRANSAKDNSIKSIFEVPIFEELLNWKHKFHCSKFTPGSYDSEENNQSLKINVKVTPNSRLFRERSKQNINYQ